MKKIILTIILTIAISISGFLIYISNGYYDVSQTTPHNGMTKWLIRKTKHGSIDKRITENIFPKP